MFSSSLLFFSADLSNNPTHFLLFDFIMTCYGFLASLPSLVNILLVTLVVCRSGYSVSNSFLIFRRVSLDLIKSEIDVQK